MPAAALDRHLATILATFQVFSRPGFAKIEVATIRYPCISPIMVPQIRF